MIRRLRTGRRPLLVLLRVLPQADRRGAVTVGLGVLCAAGSPLATTLATGALVSAVAAEVARPGSGRVGPALAVVVVTLFFQRVGLAFLPPAVEGLGHRLDLFVRERVMRVLLRPPTIAHLEDPRVADELHLARRVGTEDFRSADTLQALVALVSGRLLAAGSGLVLLGFRWWAPLVVAAAWWCSHGWYREETAGLIESMERSTPALRRAEYAADLALDGSAAKEVRIFGLRPWLSARLERSWREGMDAVWRARAGRRAAMIRSGAVLLGAHGLVFVALAHAALGGEIGVGELTVYVVAVLGLEGFSFDVDTEYLVSLGAASVAHALSIGEAVGEVRVDAPRRLISPLRHGIALEGVTFAYPRSDRPVLSGFHLDIPAGRSLAIVGDNGAGKTTIVNLLCSFYLPTGGRVLVDGDDVIELGRAAWQRCVGAVFQDFGRYQLSLSDNVAFGNLRLRTDEAARRRVAEAAGLGGLVDGAGWEAVLSRRFRDGTDLSGGQWQRVALARALLAVEAGARLLVLDEPTAHLDATAEAWFYDRFLDLTRGLTTVVVSHRFSTVRRADRIVVVDGGRVIEDGSHDELMALGGRYATMFSLQAAAYLTPGGLAPGPGSDQSFCAPASTGAGLG